MPVSTLNGSTAKGQSSRMKSGPCFLDPSVIKRRSRPRRGRIADKAYLAFIAAQPCLICGDPSTVHHVRTLGGPKDDTRTLPLCPAHHMIQWGPESIEALGKKKFEERHGINIEESVAHYREMYAGLKLRGRLPDGDNSAVAESGQVG